MNTEILTRDSARLVRPLGHVMAQASRLLDAPLPVGKHQLGDRSFFEGKSIQELTQSQGAGPVKDISVFAGGIPDDEDVDEMLEEIYRLREQLTKAIFQDFVRLVEGIPKVWAVYVRCDNPIVHIWTYVDSTDWKDRSPVYNAEWEMLKRYPKTPFDFNVELAAAGSEDFEGENTAFVFKR